MLSVGLRFKKIRLELRLSQEALAEKFGITKAAVSAVERGKSFLNVKNLSILLLDYNVNLNYLICGIGEPFNPPQYEQVEDELTQKVEDILKKKGLI